MYKCRICGKTDENVELLIGGIVGYAHAKCLEHVDRIVDVFLEYVITAPNGTLYLAEELIKAYKRVHENTESISNTDKGGPSC